MCSEFAFCLTLLFREIPKDNCLAVRVNRVICDISVAAGGGAHALPEAAPWRARCFHMALKGLLMHRVNTSKVFDRVFVDLASSGFFDGRIGRVGFLELKS